MAKEPSPSTTNARHRQGKALFRRLGRSGIGTGTSGGATLRPGASRRARLRYRFDTALAKGPSVVISWLGLVTLAIIVIAAVVLTIFRIAGVNGSEKSLSIREALWQSLLRVLDSGSFAADTSWWSRLVGLAITLAGIFLAGSLIGLIANAVDQRIEELRKGRSTVIEHDHTLILGWSNRVPAILRELVVANASRPRAVVVVLADHDKTEMEDVIRTEVGELRTTRVVCRRGEPWLPQNLEMANLTGARSVVVIGAGDDAATVKVLLAVRAVGADALDAHVVAELVDPATATSLEALIGPSLVTVRSDDVVAELTAQACRQRGLSTVFRELLDFDGDELYFAPFPQLVGKTYAQAQLSFERSSIIGVLRDGSVRLNPPPDDVIRPGDELIGIAEDDSVFLPAPAPIAATTLDVDGPRADNATRRIVISGWSTLGPRVVDELDEFLDAGTTIELLLDPERVDVEAVRASVHPRNVHIEVSELSAGPEVVAAHAARIAFHEVIVLGYRDVMSVDDADALTLLTLLAFRQVRQDASVGPVRMVAELLDQRHSPLATASGADDFIVSDELTSLMLAQLSERGELRQVFDDLFDRGGCSIELRPAPNYGAHNASSFGQIVATASMLGQSAIGFRRAATGEVVVNPAKASAPGLRRDDEILILAPPLVRA